MTIRLLHAADLHLDSPFALASTSRAPLNATLEAFSNVISLALREKVDAVVLAGDLYERRDRSVRARFHLQRELERLDAARIPSFIVHGNHDPLSGDPGGVQLPASTTVFGASLGEVVVHSVGGAVRFRVQGISFQEAQVHENLSRQFQRYGPEPTIGVLHCNLGNHGAHAAYAPCTADDLDAAGLDYWALGHVHTRQTVVLKSGGVAAYPGNTQGRQVNETGARGCLLVELDEQRERAPRVQFVPCDVARWHRLEVDLGALETLDAVLEQAERQAETIDLEGQGKHHVFRVVLTGRTSLHRQLTASALLELEQALSERWASRPWSLESLRSSTSTPFDLQRLAASGGLAGELAKLMQKPVAAEVTAQLLSSAGLAPVQAQLEAARIATPEVNGALLERALARALELVTVEGSA